MTTWLLHDLLYDQLGVTSDIEPSDSKLGGDVQTVDKCLIVGDRLPGTTRWYMGRTIRGGPAHEIKTGTALLGVHRKRL
jgi:hypothetical protein